MLQIIADWVGAVHMRMAWLGLETKPKTKQMVTNSCCLVLVKIFHAAWGGNLLVICVDVGFALPFYLIDFKYYISFLFEHAVLWHFKYLNTESSHRVNFYIHFEVL